MALVTRASFRMVVTVSVTSRARQAPQAVYWSQSGIRAKSRATGGWMKKTAT